MIYETDEMFAELREDLEKDNVTYDKLGVSIISDEEWDFSEENTTEPYFQMPTQDELDAQERKRKMAALDELTRISEETGLGYFDCQYGEEFEV